MASSNSPNNIISASDIIIPVMGITGSGKSTFIARCTGINAGIGHRLRSHTSDVDVRSFKYKGHTVRLVDTPGFDDSRNEFDDATILNQIAGWLMLASNHKPPLRLSGIIYLHPINEAGGRMRGTAKNNLKMFQAMCGDEPMSSVVVATTMWSKIDESIGVDLQKQLTERYWDSMIKAGSKVTRHDDSSASALRIIEHIVNQKTQVNMGLQKQLRGGMMLEDTDAGKQLRSKVIDEQNRARSKLRDAEDDLEQALRDQDNTAATEILQLQEKHDATIRAKEMELNSMKRRADDIYQQTLDSIAAAEKEDARLREEVANMKRQIELAKGQQLELARGQQMELTRGRQNELARGRQVEPAQGWQVELAQGQQLQRPAPPPSNYTYGGYAGSSTVDLQRMDPLAEMQLQLQQKQMEMERRMHDAQMQVYFHQASMGIANQQLHQAKRGVKWGKTSAIVGASAAVVQVACTVM